MKENFLQQKKTPNQDFLKPPKYVFAVLQFNKVTNQFYHMHIILLQLRPNIVLFSIYIFIF